MRLLQNSMTTSILTEHLLTQTHHVLTKARILRYAMTNFIFREEPAGQVRHTALSAHLSRSPATVAFQRTLATVFNPANACIPAAVRSSPATASLTQTAHKARPRDVLSMPFCAVFDRGMEGTSRGGQRLQDTDLRAYPWAAGALPPQGDGRRRRRRVAGPLCARPGRGGPSVPRRSCRTCRGWLRGSRQSLPLLVLVVTLRREGEAM